MKQEILNRIKQLGGNIDKVQSRSLQEDLLSISFNTVLFLKPEDTPWQTANNTEPIYGLGEWVDANMGLLKFDKETFYKKMLDTYYTLDKEPRMQRFWVARSFTPFREGTNDFDEWNDWFSEETDLNKILQHSNSSTPDFVELFYTDSYPNHYYICLSDLNPDNPIIWSTDHEAFFIDVTNEGTLEEFLNKCMTKDELIDIVMLKFEQQGM